MTDEAQDPGPCTRKGPERSRFLRRLVPCPYPASESPGRCWGHWHIEANAHFDALEEAEAPQGYRRVIPVVMNPPEVAR